MWHVISRSGVVISITNCYIRFTLLYLLLFTNEWVVTTVTTIPEFCFFVYKNMINQLM